MNSHDKNEDHKTNKYINDLAEKNTADRENSDVESQDDLILDDEGEAYNLDEEDQDEEAYEIEDDGDEPYEDEEGDADDEEGDTDNDEDDEESDEGNDRPAKPQGRGLRRGRHLP